MVGAATVGAVIWSVTAGSALASASHPAPLGHPARAAGEPRRRRGQHRRRPGLALKGSGVMAAVVGALALFALAFLVVTFIRRRITAA